MGNDHVQNIFVLFDADGTVLTFNDTVGAACVKACDNFPFFVSADRKLCFVAVIPRNIHADAVVKFRCIFCIEVQFSDTLQISLYLLRLKLKLCRIVHFLNLTAAAASCHRTARSNSVLRWGNYFHQPCKAVIFLHFHHLDTHRITNQGILYKKGKTIYMAYTLSIDTHIFYFQYKFIVFLYHDLPHLYYITLHSCLSDIYLKQTVIAQPVTTICRSCTL